MSNKGLRQVARMDGIVAVTCDYQLTSSYIQLCCMKWKHGYWILGKGNAPGRMRTLW